MLFCWKRKSQSLPIASVKVWERERGVNWGMTVARIHKIYMSLPIAAHPFAYSVFFCVSRHMHRMFETEIWCARRIRRQWGKAGSASLTASANWSMLLSYSRSSDLLFVPHRRVRRLTVWWTRKKASPILPTSTSARQDKSAASNMHDHPAARQSQPLRSCNWLFFLLFPFPTGKKIFWPAALKVLGGNPDCLPSLQILNQRDHSFLVHFLRKTVLSLFANNMLCLCVWVYREEQVTLWGGLFGLLAVIAVVVFCRRSEQSLDLCAILSCSCLRNRSNKIAAVPPPDKHRFGHKEIGSSFVAHETRL